MKDPRKLKVWGKWYSYVLDSIDESADANDLGITVTYNKDEKGNNTTLNKDKTLEQIQTVAKLKYEKASRIYSMFTKIMENAHQMLMQIINKIG